MYTCIHIHVYACIPSTTWIGRIKIKLPGLVAEDLTLDYQLYLLFSGSWSIYGEAGRSHTAHTGFSASPGST